MFCPKCNQQQASDEMHLEMVTTPGVTEQTTRRLDQNSYEKK